ncbi:MAG: MerR family transcriptional regulator, partial [Proteobacteria bacterium]|nr:MerR family transcriptional regulator [Pseudomonadota bacterium]
GFTTNEVTFFTGVSARRLRWWDKKGLIKPTINPGRKPHQARRYTIRDLICILVVRDLKEKGLSLQIIRKSVERIKATGIEHPLSRLRVACLSSSVFFKKDGKYIDPISGQIVIEEAIEKIRPKLENRRLAPAVRAIERENKNFQERVKFF